MRTSSEHDIALRAALEAARKARASNDSVEAKQRCAHTKTSLGKVFEWCDDCGSTVRMADEVRAAIAPQPDRRDGTNAPRLSDRQRTERIEAALDTLFAAVGLAPDGMNSAWIAAKKLWDDAR